MAKVAASIVPSFDDSLPIGGFVLFRLISLKIVEIVNPDPSRPLAPQKNPQGKCDERCHGNVNLTVAALIERFLILRWGNPELSKTVNHEFSERSFDDPPLSSPNQSKIAKRKNG
jgi:hypothetical protein